MTGKQVIASFPNQICYNIKTPVFHTEVRYSFLSKSDML